MNESGWGLCRSANQGRGESKVKLRVGNGCDVYGRGMEGRVMFGKK